MSSTLMSSAVYNQLQCTFQELETASFDVKTICQLVEEHAAKNPHQIALEYQDRTISYQALNEITNQLARYIRKQYQLLTQHELPADTLIPISLGRSAEYVIGILGILKSGAAYVPINPDYPETRIRHILSDIRSPLIITESHIANQFKSYDEQMFPICFDEQLFLAESVDNLYVPICPNDLAYVIYTSGSSGTPKGVMAEHKNVISQVVCASYFSANESDTIAFFSDVSFDSTTFEIWGALLNGAKLFIPDNFYELISNAELFKQTVKEKNLTIVLLTRSLFDLLFTQDESVYADVKTMLVGAEALTKNIMEKLINSPHKPPVLINAYGPTENSTFCVTNRLGKDFSQLHSVPIGRPYSNRIGLVLDKHFQLMPIGVTGELFVGGPSLSRGYLNQPELTQEKFIPNRYFEDTGKHYPRIYKTNDMVKWLGDGLLEYVARNDFQVKLRGYRIELGEIETRLLEYPGVKHSVVLMEKANSLAYLVGYYLADEPLDDEKIRDYLLSVLPDYMVPSVFVYLDTFPVTPNGKLDRRALPKPSLPDTPKTMQSTEQQTIEQVIAEIWSKTLGIQHFSREQSFFNLGGNSLAAMMVRKELEDAFAIKINIVELFEHTTLALLSARISELVQSCKESSSQLNQSTVDLQTHYGINEPIAVVGMSCRLPGVQDVDAFWDLVSQGKSNLRDFSDEELRAHLVDESLINSSSYVKRGTQFDTCFQFDAGFFGYSVKDAETMDPQQRQFLECSWEALEHSGNIPEKFNGEIGVFAAEGRNYYFMEHVYQTASANENLFQAILGNEKDFLSTRVSFKLNLTGPSITMQTACSSSLVSVQMACESLKLHNCDMALAGGVSIFYNHGYPYQDDLIESPDGYCRAFDAKAKGTVVTSGVGVVVLKRLSDAIAQKDTIYAVIKGGAINNDGSAKMAFTAPSVKGQSTVIEKALKNANVTPDTISYIESHGTGTMVGDPIEWTSLHQVYQKYATKPGYCTIGALKTNIGHTDSAAGVMGLIKTALALKHKIKPATLNFEQLNPEIASFNQLFQVSSQTTKWDAEGSIRRAAISSFGLGGTNAHMILEEYPEKPSVTVTNIRAYLIPLSAKNSESLAAMVSHLEQFLPSSAGYELPNIAFTAQFGRAEFKERGYIIASTDGTYIQVVSSYINQDGYGVSQLFFGYCELIMQFMAISAEYHHELIHILSLQMIGHLWTKDVDIDWSSVNQFDASVHKTNMPTYCFIHKHYEIPKVIPKEVVVDELIQVSEPTNSLEVELKNRWSKALGVDVDELTHTSHFFDLGGDSLSFIDLFHDIKKAIFANLNLEDLLQYDEFGSMYHYLNAKVVESGGN